MNRLPLTISGFTGSAGRFSGLAGQILADRSELLALEMREAQHTGFSPWYLDVTSRHREPGTFLLRQHYDKK